MFKLQIENNVGVIRLNKEGSDYNTISMDDLDSMVELLDQIENDESVKGAVFYSEKKDFLAGADIKKFLEMSEDDTREVGKTGHALFNRIEDSKKPFVAVIHGACMGGGTELALACHGLVITDSPKTKLGLPEVKLGLLPGLGGTVRLYKRIGLPDALDYILTGKNMYASRAKKFGLADAFVDENFRLKAGIQLVHDIASGKHTTNKSKGLSFKDKTLLFGPVKSFVISKAKDNVMAKTQGNYPAPLEILKCLEHHPGKSREEAIKREIEGFTKLLHSPEARQLIRLFFLMNDYKKNPYADDLKEAPEHLSVLGAGLMGNGISTVSIDNGYKVSLLDLSDDALKKAKQKTSEYLEKKVKRKQITRSEYQKLLNDLQLIQSGDPVKSDALIEAVFEDLDLKQKILKKWSESLDPDALIATNTSALPVSEIAEVCKNPERVLGMHYFSQVEKMPLLEIIKTDKTSNNALAKAYDIGLNQGKVCIDVSDGPGFYTTRILAPMLNEAMIALSEGYEPKSIDSIMKKRGFPVGPITLIDEIGIDVGAHINRGALGELFKSRGSKAHPVMEIMEDKDWLGKKSGKGFYVYEDKKKTVNPELANLFGDDHSFDKKADSEVADRLMMIMINESFYCLQDKILKDAESGDVGAIFGLGFPPFTGGPFMYTHKKGIENIIDLLNTLKDKYHNRFEPAPILIEYNEQGKEIYKD